VSINRAENIFPKYLLYYLHEIARKYPREKKYSSSFYDSVAQSIMSATDALEQRMAGPPRRTQAKISKIDLHPFPWPTTMNPDNNSAHKAPTIVAYNKREILIKRNRVQVA
jgi:hypothetical protein